MASETRKDKDTKSKKFKPLPIEEIVTRSVVDEIFANYDPAITVLRFEAAKGTNNGDNYLSLMYTIDVDTIRGLEQSIVQQYHLMFKTIPRNPVRVQMIQPLKLFQREIIMYKEVLSVWSSQHNFHSFPKCLHAAAHSIGTGDYIAMENVRVHGYKMLPRFLFLDLPHAKFVMDQLARFHAISYNLWKGDADPILAKYPILVDPVWIDPGLADPLNKLFVDNSFPELLKLLRINNCDEETCAKLATFSDGIEERMFAVLQKTGNPAKFPNVINHGDPWINNFMFRYDEQGNVTDMKFVDFQVAKVGSRVIDLSYALYTSLQIPVLNGHLMELLKLYHETFLAHIQDEKHSDLLTWEAFVEEWGMYRLYGLTMALVFCPAMNADPSSIPDFETLSMEDLAGTSEKKDKHEAAGDKGNFSNFMKSEHISSRVINLVKNHI